MNANLSRTAKAATNEGSTDRRVPIFIPEVSIESQRSSGYVDTHSAVNEFIDNAIDARATAVWVYYLPRRHYGRLASHDIVVLDNGSGMDPHTLQKALAFGGGNRFNREAIGRFAYGLPNAAISQGQRLEVYSWQRPDETYKAILDVAAVKDGRQKGIEPTELEEVPEELVKELLKPIGEFPAADEQKLHLMTIDNWPEHGTLIHVSNCDQLTWKQTKPFVEHSWVLGRLYRYRMWASGVRIYVNNRLIESVDPLYVNPNARHYGAAPYGEELRIPIPLWDPALLDSKRDKLEVPTAEVVIRLSRLPIPWMGDDRKINANQRKIYHHTKMSVLRAERELELAFRKLFGRKEEDQDNWWGGEIHIPPVLDEAFGVMNNKQGIHPKQYVRDLLLKEVWPLIADLRNKIQKERKDEKAKRRGGQPTYIERRAAEADRLLGSARRVPTDSTYQALVDQEMLRFARAHLRDGETPEAALERIKQSPYLLEFEHQPEGPFYRVETFGRIIVLRINRAHPFFDKVWEPLGDVDRVDETASLDTTTNHDSPQAALAMLLFTLARVEVESLVREGSEEWFQDVRGRWSAALRTFLNTLG